MEPGHSTGSAHRKHWPGTRPDPVKIADPVTRWPVTRFHLWFIDVRLRPGIAMPLMAVAARCSLHVLASRPLQLNMTSSIKPEVHNVAQRRRGRTELRPQGIRAQNFVRIGPAVPEICSRTDRQTHRQTGWSQYSVPIPGRSNEAGDF